MDRECRKCGTVAEVDVRNGLAECPQCGAIYSRVQASLEAAARQRESAADSTAARAARRAELVRNLRARPLHEKVLLAVFAASVALTLLSIVLVPDRSQPASIDVTRSAHEPDPDTPAATATSAAPPVSDADCRKNIHCWASRLESKMWTPCRRAVEAQAQYQAEWTDGFLGSKFERYAWAEPRQGAVAWYGSSVRFQNGFGAWQNMSYSCIYYPDTGLARAAVFPTNG